MESLLNRWEIYSCHFDFPIERGSTGNERLKLVRSGKWTVFGGSPKSNGYNPLICLIPGEWGVGAEPRNGVFLISSRGR